MLIMLCLTLCDVGADHSHSSRTTLDSQNKTIYDDDPVARSNDDDSGSGSGNALACLESSRVESNRKISKWF